MESKKDGKISEVLLKYNVNAEYPWSWINKNATPPAIMDPHVWNCKGNVFGCIYKDPNTFIHASTITYIKDKTGIWVYL